MEMGANWIRGVPLLEILSAKDRLKHVEELDMLERRRDLANRSAIRDTLYVREAAGQAAP
jgi:hypothetical protein